MTKSFNIEQLKAERKPVHSKCLGEGFTEDENKFMQGTMCKRVEERMDENNMPIKDDKCVCTTYLDPSMKWRPGFRCLMASNYRPDLAPEKKKKINPLKASKRAKKKK